MQYLKLRAHGHKVFLPCRLYAAGRLVGLYPILSYLWRLLQHLREVHQLDKQGVFHFYLRRISGEIYRLGGVCTIVHM